MKYPLPSRLSATLLPLLALSAPVQAQIAKPLFTSPVLTSTSKERTIPVDVNLTGAKELFLVVSEVDSDSCDWAAWLEPQLIMADGKSIDLTSLKWKSASAGHGKPNMGKNYEGKPVKVGQKEYIQAIGTHASSVIAFDLPAGAVRFKAQVAIDDGGMERAGKPSNADVKFLVYTQNPGDRPNDPAPGVTEVPVDLFTLPEGLEITLWAKAPALRNPTNIDFDAAGRLYVAEGVNYRGKAGRDKAGDRIIILADTKGTGQADSSTVFVQESELASPLGVAVFDNQIVVSQPPDMIVYTDVNRDGKFDATVDKREVLLTGFGGRQHDHSLHSVTAGPDGLWYWNQGNTGANFKDKSGKQFFMGSPYMMGDIAGKKSDDGNIWIGGFTARMNPDGHDVTIIGHNYRNSYEQTINSLGDLYQSDNDDPPACRVTPILEGGNAGFASADGKRSWGADKRPEQDTATAEWRQEDPGTMPAGDVYGGGSPTGVGFYENGALGDKWNGLLLACEAGKNVVFGYLPKPDGAGFKLERMDFLTSNKEKEFAGSDFLGGKANDQLKTKFRPSDVCVGPDGAIYVADWFDARVGGHGTMDNTLAGAIYRIAPKGFKSVVPKIDLNTTAGQVSALLSPAANLRYSGFIRLKAQGAKAVPEVAEILNNKNPYLAARAAWLLAQMGPTGIAKVTPWLASSDPTQRLVAYRALRRANHEVLAMATKMAGDASPALRREVALTMRNVPVAQSLPVLTKVAEQFDGTDRTYLEAFGLGCTGKEAEVYAALAKTMGQGAPDTWPVSFAGLAWRLHPAAAVPGLKARVLAEKLPLAERKRMLTGLAFIKSREAAGAMMELASNKGFPMQDLAKWWLMNRKGNDWKDFDIDAGLKALGLYDPDKVKLTSVEMPPVPADAPKLPSLAEIAKLPGDATRGQAMAAACTNCHRIGNAGVDFGPNLTTFAKQQPTEVIINGIINPSADISHGFEGSEIKTKDGLTITGMVLSEGDPLIIKCMGGLLQTIPQNRIASSKKMGISLMYQPSQLGLTAQMIADIVAHLQKLK